MRRKAENRIRSAAGEIAAASGASAHADFRYPLDEVRSRSGLFPKVFDKTILDMARLGAIRLLAEDLCFFTPAEVRGMVRSGETVFTAFHFDDGTRFSTASPISSPDKTPADPPGAAFPDETSPILPQSSVPPDDAVSAAALLQPVPAPAPGDSEDPLSGGPIRFPLPEEIPEEGKKDGGDIPEPVILILQGLHLSEWEAFERYCHKEAGLPGAEMIERMIREMLKKD